VELLMAQRIGCLDRRARVPRSVASADAVMRGAATRSPLASTPRRHHGSGGSPGLDPGARACARCPRVGRQRDREAVV